MENLVIYERPKLKKPYMVVGISGWVDGGEAATGSVRYLVNKLSARKLGEIPIAGFHVFEVPGINSMRPHIEIKDGILQQHKLPGNEFFYWVNEKSEHDLILFRGTEPSLRWEQYLEAVLNVAEEFKVARVYSLGGVIDDTTPYTREPHVSCAASHPKLKEEMSRYAILFTNYEGPGSINTALLDASMRRGMEYVSLIGRSFWYPEFDINVPQNPKVIYALLSRLNRLLGIDLDLSTLVAASRELEEKLNSMASQIQGFRSYIAELEREFEELKYEESIQMEGDEAIRAVEEFLREKENGEEEPQ